MTTHHPALIRLRSAFPAADRRTVRGNHRDRPIWAEATSRSIDKYLLYLQRGRISPRWTLRQCYCRVVLLIHCTRWIVEVTFVASAPPVVIVVEGNHGGAKPGLFVKRRSK